MSHYKPYPAYKDSGVEWLKDVPVHWEIAPLWSVYRPIKRTGFTNEPLLSVYRDHGVVLKSSRDDNRNRASDDLGPYQLVEPGQLVTNKMKTWQGSIAVSELRGIVSPAYFIYEPIRSVFGRFVHHLMRCGPYVTGYLSVSKGIRVGQWDLDPDHFRTFPVLFPPKEEQERIVESLDRETTRIDALIAKKTEFIELLAKKRQALITHAVTKGLKPKAKMKDSGVEWIGEVPAHWNVVQIRHVAILGSGHTPSRSRPDWWEDCHIPWFTLADIWQVRREGRRYVFETEETVSDLGIENSSATVHPAGSVMLSRTASVGFPAIMGCDMATSQDFAVWRCGERVHNEFLYLVLLGMKQELACLMIGSTHKTIYMPDIEALRMPLPSIDEQKAIIEYVDYETKRIDRLTELTTASIDLLKKRRSALITAAVTGQIDLRESA